MNKLDHAIRYATHLALLNGLSFAHAPAQSRQCAFTLTPSTIARSEFDELKLSAQAYSKLIHAIAKDDAFIEQAIAPTAGVDVLFQRLLEIHRRLTASGERRATPFLVMRSDFMADPNVGYGLIELNAIAAGMAPFGTLVSHLHQRVQEAYPVVQREYGLTQSAAVKPVENNGIEGLAAAFAEAARRVHQRHGSQGRPVMLLVNQENEDNVFDQMLLTESMARLGVDTVRRSFSELNGALTTGEAHRLLLDGEIGIDLVYLRAGYTLDDYCLKDAEEPYCCHTLLSLREVLERHDIALNATVAQQLATSKRVQLLLAHLTHSELSQYGLSEQEQQAVRRHLVPMVPVDEHSLALVQASRAQEWVLKNQGEGGGHCYFDDAIAVKLAEISAENYHEWALMKRLHPVPSSQNTVILRHGEAEPAVPLINEIGLFTTQIGDDSDPQYIGYLVRSKPFGVHEGGVHSGQGAVDSLVASVEN